MNALLLAAGYGSRLSPLTDVLPKCLMPVNGRPLIDIWLSQLRVVGINKVLINLHHHAAIVEQYIKDSSHAAFVTLVYEEELLNTGGTLLNNREFFDADNLMLIHGDNVCDCNLTVFMEEHENRPLEAEITMMTFDSKDPQSCGIVEVGADRIVRYYFEKPAESTASLANAAIYILEQSVFDYLQGLGKTNIDFSNDVIPGFMGRIYTYHNDSYLCDIGTLKSYLTAQVGYPIQYNRKMDNAWAAVCNKYDIGFKLSEAVAKAMNLPLLDTGSQVKDFVPGESIWFIEHPDLIKELISKRNNPRHEGIDIVINRVGASFSSWDFYREYGLKCLAIMVDDSL